MNRNVRVFVGIVAVSILIGAGSYYLATGSFEGVFTSIQGSASAVPFTTLARGTQSDIPVRVNYLIRSNEELQELWGLIDAPSTPPQIDFSKDAVIAVFAGKHPAVSDAISVAEIIDASARRVSITLVRPDSTCPLPAIATPYEIVSVSATQLPLRHRDVVSKVECE